MYSRAVATAGHGVCKKGEQALLWACDAPHALRSATSLTAGAASAPAAASSPEL